MLFRESCRGIKMFPSILSFQIPYRVTMKSLREKNGLTAKEWGTDGEDRWGSKKKWSDDDNVAPASSLLVNCNVSLSCWFFPFNLIYPSLPLVSLIKTILRSSSPALLCWSFCTFSLFYSNREQKFYGPLLCFLRASLFFFSLFESHIYLLFLCLHLNLFTPWTSSTITSTNGQKSGKEGNKTKRKWKRKSREERNHYSLMPDVIFSERDYREL